MRIPRDMAQGRLLRALTTTLVLVLLAAVLLAGSALAAAKPAKPTAKAPKGNVATTKPTFTWSKAAGAAKYEVRVYKDGTLQFKKTGITKLSWKSSKALPTNVSLTWKVRAGNSAGNGAWSKSLRFKVVTSASAKAMTAFVFASPATTGVINETLHTIALTVPFGTDLRALVATFTTTGASVAIAGAPQTSGTTPNDFTNPVTYTVMAADSSTQDYVVTVAVAAGSAKAITAFTIPGQVGTTAINETDKTIALTVPSGTDLTNLVPAITITGVSVGPASGVANNFTSPVTYTVTAVDASIQAYTVTVAEAAAVQIMSLAFSPKTLTIKLGKTVVWTNNDPVSHTVTAVDSLNLNAVPTGLFNSGPIASGNTFHFTFTALGTFFYRCQIHSLTPAMHAQVNVVE